jgi:hypothetical protein
MKIGLATDMAGNAAATAVTAAQKVRRQSRIDGNLNF